MCSFVQPARRCAVLAACVVSLFGVVTSCDDELDYPPMVVPSSQHQPNMSIAEFKSKYWQDGVNYVDTVTDDVVIHGWVTSSDQDGNVYKKLYIQDESGMGLTIAVNQSSLFEKYRIGQDVVLPLQGYYVGKYNGQQELGFPDTANFTSHATWRMTFMSQQMWESIVELNEFFNPSRLDTLVISIGDLADKTNASTLMKYQGALVRINGVTFKDADGKSTFAVGDNSTNRNVVDAAGRELVVRSSNHAVFATLPLPQGRVDVVGLLDLYTYTNNAAGVWQLTLRSIGDVITGAAQP